MNRNKSAGSDGIVIEILLVLDVFGIDKTAKIITEKYDSDYITHNLSRSIFMALAKCQWMWISLYNQINDPFGFWWIERVGVLEWKWSKNSMVSFKTLEHYAIFMIKRISDRAIRIQKEISIFKRLQEGRKIYMKYYENFNDSGKKSEYSIPSTRNKAPA